MLTTIRNDRISLAIDSLGAQMMELNDAEDTQYLWNGDSRYWKKRAINLFPYVGRLTEGRYLYDGQAYSMGIHGFASQSEFELVEKTPVSAAFRLTENACTLESFPFSFVFEVGYELEGSTVKICFTVKNRSERLMPFGLGGHPGFRVPLASETEYSDYYLEFGTACKPWRVGFTENLLLSGNDTPFALEKDKLLRLEHRLFNDDAIILKHMAKSVTLKSDKTQKFVRLSYPQMPYLGLWHKPNSDAPYLCIEPWLSLPSRDGVFEEILCKSDMLALQPNAVYRNEWSISIA